MFCALVCYGTVITSCGHAVIQVYARASLCLFVFLIWKFQSLKLEKPWVLRAECWVLCCPLTSEKRGTLVCHLGMLLYHWVLCCLCMILQVISMSCQSPVFFLCATGFWSLISENSFSLPIDGKVFAASLPSSSVVLFICCVTDLVLIWSYGQTVFLFFLWADSQTPSPFSAFLLNHLLLFPRLNLSRTSQSSCGLPDLWLSHFSVLTLSLGPHWWSFQGEGILTQDLGIHESEEHFPSAV